MVAQWKLSMRRHGEEANIREEVNRGLIVHKKSDHALCFPTATDHPSLLNHFTPFPSGGKKMNER